VIEKSEEAYRTIGEVAERLDLPPHVLRFWETRFKEIAPVKRAGGRRFYRPRDVELVAAIRHLLYGEGYTIKGVQRLLKESGTRAVIESARSGAPLRPLPVETGEAPPEPPQVFAEEERPEPTLDAPVFAPEPEEPEPTPRTPPQVINLPALTARPFEGATGALEPEDAARLRAALAELAECRRLLLLTKR
jgi:DNA-binding transcriptional MerR regulator